MPLTNVLNLFTVVVGQGTDLVFLLHRFTQYNGEVQYACTLWKTSLHHLLKQELLEITNIKIISFFKEGNNNLF